MKQLILLFITMIVLVACTKSNTPSINKKFTLDGNYSLSAQESDTIQYLAKVENDLNNSYKIFLSEGSSDLVRKVAAQLHDNEILIKKANDHCKKVSIERGDLLTQCIFFTETFWLDKDTASEYQAAVSKLSNKLQLEDLILRNEITVNMKNTQNLHNYLLKSNCIYAQEYAKRYQIYISTLKDRLDKGIYPYN